MEILIIALWEALIHKAFPLVPYRDTGLVERSYMEQIIPISSIIISHQTKFYDCCPSCLQIVYTIRKVVFYMRTTEEILNYLETKLAEAYKWHNESKRKEDKGDAYASLVRIVMLEEILEDIKK